MKRITIIAGVAAALAAFAVAQDAAGPRAPAAAPQASAEATSALADLPPLLTGEATLDDADRDEAGVRRSVVFGGLDKITARTFTFEAPVGKTVRFKKLYVVARMCHKRPPEETPETAVFVEVYQPVAADDGPLRRSYSGWMFASSPGLNGFENPVYDMWVIGCRVDDPEQPELLAVNLPPKAFSETDDEDAEINEPSVEDVDAARE